MGRLAMFLEGFKKGTKVRLLNKNRELIFDGVKEDIPHRFEDQTNILLGQTEVSGDIVTIVINYEENY